MSYNYKRVKSRYRLTFQVEIPTSDGVPSDMFDLEIYLVFRLPSSDETHHETLTWGPKCLSIIFGRGWTLSFSKISLWQAAGDHEAL